jgi:hypothetical protein
VRTGRACIFGCCLLELCLASNAIVYGRQRLTKELSGNYWFSRYYVIGWPIVFV